MGRRDILDPQEREEMLELLVGMVLLVWTAFLVNWENGALLDNQGRMGNQGHKVHSGIQVNYE